MKRATIGLLVLALTLGGAGQVRAGFQTGLIGYWPFDGNGNDRSGNGRNLNLVGNPGFAPGLFGQALDLHGNGSQFAQRPVDDSLFRLGASDFTIQIWVNFNSHDREQTLIEKFNGTSGPGWTMTTPGQHFQFYSIATGPINSPDGLTTPGVWHDVIARRSGSTFDLIVDGGLVAAETRNRTLFGTSMPLLVGRRDSGDPRDFSVDGRLDEAAIWDRALTDTEIATLWNGGKGTPVINAAAAPEPASLTLMGLGLAGLLGYGWRRRQRK
jgi:MYXO-CTERM domain-containing protein